MKTNKNLSELDKTIIALLIALGSVLAVMIAAAFLLPPQGPKPVMTESNVLVYANADGTLDVYWPELPEGCTGHARLQNATGSEKSDHITISPKGGREPVQIQLYAAAEGKNMFGVFKRLESTNCLEIVLDLTDPQTLRRPELTYQYHESGTLQTDLNGTLELTWNGREDVPYEIYRMDGDKYEALKAVEDLTATLRFGKGGDLAVPEQTAQFAVRWVDRQEGYIFYGPLSDPVSMTRDSMLPDALSVRCTETGDRLYTLQWNETPGDYYEIQRWNWKLERWDTVGRVDSGETLAYETGRLASGADCRYQVTAYQQATSVATPKAVAGPSNVSFRVSFSPLYATVWPIMDLPLYGEDSGTLATIPGGTALCVLEEKDGSFYVRFQNYYGYVDSRFCMIDLTEYVGDLCEYNITNSYSSVFKIHEYSIDQITGQVITGFENVLQADGTYLVPLLYPTAQKLIKAAEAAEKDGYRLKIYEAYRPNAATRFLYDTTLAQLDNPVPGQDGAEQSSGALPASAARMMPEDVPETIPEPEAGTEPETVPEPVPETETVPENVVPAPSGVDAPIYGNSDEPPEESGPAEPAEPAESTEPVEPVEPAEPAESTEPAAPAVPAESTESQKPAASVQPAKPQTPVRQDPPKPEVITLRKIMTDGRYQISAFLAASISNHNRGVALDLTLETISDGQELEMQSAIHDLSWYAVTNRNNDNAKLLEKYMKDTGGMAGLSSEWWHFQDDEIKAELNLTGYLAQGVSAEGWKKDDTGWQYRKPDGSVYRSASILVDGKRYKINADGYAVE